MRIVSDPVHTCRGFTEDLMTLQQANRILEKLQMPGIRRANRKEQYADEYGVKHHWVIDRGEFQALKAYPTLAEAFAYALRYIGSASGWETLTPAEQQIIRRIV
jgi:hypothetical protein